MSTNTKTTSSPDDGLAKLTTEYDRLISLRRETETETPRADKLQHIAKAVRAGKPAPDLWENVASRTLKLDGINLAISALVSEIGDHIGRQRERQIAFSSLHIDTSAAVPSGAGLVAYITEAFDAADRGHAAGQQARERKRAYDDANDELQAQKWQHERNGGDPRTFQAQLTDVQWAALNPAGSGGFNISGRTLATATVGGGV
jgi:hypothetical protein